MQEILKTLMAKIRALNPAIATAIAVFLLVILSAVTYSHRGGWIPNGGVGDEPAYIHSAYLFWTKGAVEHITWSPGYNALMSPFVGIWGESLGFGIWRFVLFTALSLLVYFNFKIISGSRFIAFVLAFYAQNSLIIYESPNVQSLVAVLFLTSMLLLSGSKNRIGIVWSVLLFGVYVSGVMSFVFMSFVIVSLLFFRKLVFSQRFLKQFSLGSALFLGCFIAGNFHKNSFSRTSADRGRAGFYNQLAQFIWSTGRTKKYKDPAAAQLKDFSAAFPYIDKYFAERFGYPIGELREMHIQDGWPSFLLNWPYLWKRDPKLMKAFALDSRSMLVDSLRNMVLAVTPFKKFHPIVPAEEKQDWTILLSSLLLAWFSFAIFLSKGARSASPPKPNPRQIAFAICCLSILVPLMLVKPLDLYFPPLIPVYLFGLVLASKYAVLGAYQALPKILPLFKRLKVSQ